MFQKKKKKRESWLFYLLHGRTIFIWVAHGRNIANSLLLSTDFAYLQSELGKILLTTAQPTSEMPKIKVSAPTEHSRSYKAWFEIF